MSILNEQDRSWIGVFLIAQHIRVKNFREVLLDMDGQVCRLIRDTGGDPDNVQGFVPLKGEDDVRQFTRLFLIKNMSKFAEVLMHKKWILLETPEQNPFWIGDNPVTMHNDQDFGPYGNIGFAVPGIQIYLPVTRTMTLGLWCSTLFEDVKKKEVRGSRPPQKFEGNVGVGRARRREACGRPS